jgi:gas vesicle protein
MLNKEELGLLNRIKNRTVYENKFFDKRSETKWFDELKKRGYFKPNLNTRPQETEKGSFLIPKWNVLPYLEKVSEKVNINDNEKYIDELLTIIREVSKYKDSKGQYIDNYRTWYYFVKILLNLPNIKIPNEIIDLIPIWLSSRFDTTLPGAEITRKLLPKFLTDNPNDIKKAEKIINHITSLKIIPVSGEKKKDLKEDEKIELLIDSHFLKEGFGKYSEDIGRKCSEKVIEDLVGKVKKLLKIKEEGTYYSFYEELDYLDKPLDVLTFILKRILIGKAKNDINITQEILKTLLKEKYLYFPKMALYIIGNDLDEYREFFWKILNDDIENIILNNSSSFGDELKHILENLKELTEKQREILKNKIEDSAKLEDFKEDQELYLALHKQQFYKALSHEQYFKKLYDEIKNVTKYDIKLRPAIGPVEVSSGLGHSPLTKEKILQMSNKELSKFLSTFRTSDHWKGPSAIGLSSILKETVKENSEKFINDLRPFLKTGYFYIYDIIWGIRDAWEDKKIFNWGKLFEFIRQYITPEDFWNDKYAVKDDGWKANHFWILGIVGELIKKGTIDNSRSFPEKYYPTAQEIIFQILDKMLLDKKELLESQSERNDFITYTLNSTFGKITEALFMLAYRIKKFEKETKSEQPVSWEINIKDKYELLLKNEIIESYVWLGSHLAIFYLLLDKNWTEEQINQISPKKKPVWEAFMQGYLNSNKIDINLYKLMQPHYETAIEYKFKEEHSSERVVQHICFVYLQGIEKINIENGLFRKILDKWNLFQIKEVIGWFWMQRDFIIGPIKEKKKTEETVRIEKMRELIIDFWRWVYQNRYKEKEQLKEEDKEILSELSKLTVFLEKIDCKNYEWLRLSAPYIHVDFNAPFFLKYLNNLKDKDKDAGEYVGKIFLEILKNSTPDYDQNDIRSIVEYLSTSGCCKERAKEICKIYGTRGFEFLRDIYERYHQR